MFGFRRKIFHNFFGVPSILLESMISISLFLYRRCKNHGRQWIFTKAHENAMKRQNIRGCSNLPWCPKIGTWVKGCKQDLTLLEFNIRIRIWSPSSLIIIQNCRWLAMSALLFRVAICVPMYLFEHHLACDLVTLGIVYILLLQIFWHLQPRVLQSEVYSTLSLKIYQI